MGRLVADTIVEALLNAGVKCCCGVLGDTLNPISRSLENDANLKMLGKILSLCHRFALSKHAR